MRARVAIGTTCDAGWLLGLLAGKGVPDGLVVDTDLRWLVVRRAAALGALGEDEIAAELAADPTASGELQATSARAALPSEAGKLQCWERMIGGQASNAQVRAIGGGFWQRGQEDLLSPYVDRYLDALPAVWETSSPQIAASITGNGFPATLIRQDVAERVGAFLERGDLPAGLRRVVLELDDDLRRALRAQSA